MNRTNNTLLLITLSVLVIASGCTSTSAVGGKTSKWLGHSESELLAALGEPDNTAALSDGRKILTWNYYNTTGQVVPCSQSYTVDPNGIVSDFVTSNCAIRPLMPETPKTRRGF
jgi:hypothetical protein